MAELYFFSFVFILIAGMLSHDRSVQNPPNERFKYWDVEVTSTYMNEQGPCQWMDT